MRLAAAGSATTARSGSYRKSGSRRWRKMTVDAPELIRRFLRHASPTGLQKVRHYGFASGNPQEVRHHFLSVCIFRDFSCFTLWLSMNASITLNMSECFARYDFAFGAVTATFVGIVSFLKSTALWPT